MTSKVLQYRGPLDAEMAFKGINAARANASRLLADAEALMAMDRQESAVTLATLAIEELGKVQIIKMIVLTEGEAALSKAWKEYRNHRAKNVQWILPGLIANGARTLAALKGCSEPNSEHTAMLETMKQLHTYTDCINKSAMWTEPSEYRAVAFAPSIIAVAKKLNRQPETSLRELELWVRFVKPHYLRSSMTVGLLDFQKAAFAEGLSTISAEAMRDFVNGNPVKVR